jgi:hypothetical protein
MLFLPNSACETAVPPHVRTVWLIQGNLNYFADLAGKRNARAKVDFYNGRQIACFPVLNPHPEDIV